MHTLGDFGVALVARGDPRGKVLDSEGQHQHQDEQGMCHTNDRIWLLLSKQFWIPFWLVGAPPILVYLIGMFTGGTGF